ncbi:MAG: endonuclease MutS2 [Bacteroidota bacterium]
MEEKNMQLELKDIYEKLEFDKLLKRVEADCLGALGVERIRNTQIATDVRLIRKHLKQVQEYKSTIDNDDRFPVRNYEDISEDLRMLNLEGFVLPEESLQRINVVLRQMHDIFMFFYLSRQKTYPNLHRIIRDYELDEGLIKAIEKVIDEEGNIRPDASPELKKIRRLVGSKERELDKVFRGVINDYRKQGWLSDNVESFRNGRRVLSVPAEHKRKIRGIIHDESTTGRTAFIEPERVIDINNDLFDLATEEKKEIYRILRDLSAVLRPYVPQIQDYQQLIATYDVIQAKARLARSMNAEMPKIVPHPSLGIQMGKHPLLLLKNKDLGRETIPFDLTLFGQNRLLMLSGPNAGGKSITMKAVGLMQLMLQAGMLVPCDEISEFGVFQQFFADIGDQQSLEDDLSTYSSRLRNMRIFLENADENTLIVIDEFGSGTDPKIGGAIAEAILHELHQKKVFGVITTHYSNLKIYAFKTKGIVNGSMLFDKDTLSPTYQLKVGRPGSSYAFEIAQKSGLSSQILKYAKHRTGKNEKAVDQLLVDLQRERQELEERVRTAEERSKKLERLIKNYEVLHQDLEFRRKKVKLEAKQQELQQSARDNKQVERLVREIKEEKNLEKAKQLAAKVKQERERKAKEVVHLKEEIYYKPKPNVQQRPIKKGDFVRMKMGSATGYVQDVSKKEAIVQMGMMRMNIKLRDLELAKEPLDIRTTKSVQTDMTESAAKFHNKLDIRGMRLEEALKMVEDFVDRALVSNADNLRILHGKGTGVLRKAVKRKLREYDAVEKMSHPAAEFGGDGVTLVSLG